MWKELIIAKVRKNIKILSQGSWSLGQDLSLGLFEYEIEC
jgi:hypothetical protein